MGIYKWYAYFSQQEAFTKSIIRYAPSNINIFAIDLNGIIHTNAQKIFGYGKNKKTDAELGLVLVNGNLVMPQEKYDELEQELFKAIFDDIVGLTKTIAPSETLIIAVDGTAPFAKINQQRNRRYKNSLDEGKPKYFDPNCITPGTEFMFRLDEYIQETLDEISEYDTMTDAEKQDPENEVIASYARGLPVRIIYSSHLVPGEGEHKIADELRQIPPNKRSVVIHGSDSDLFMIYLTQLKNGWENIYLFRDHQVFTRRDDNQRQEQPVKQYRVDTVINLKELQSVLNQLYPTAISASDDFVVLLYLNGNDFLPAFPTFERIYDALTVIINGYQNFLKENPGLTITDGSSIKWKNFGKFLQYITTKYENILLTKWAMNEDGIIQNGFAPVVLNAIQTFSQVKNGHSHLVKRFDVDQFKANWYSFVFSPKEEKQPPIRVTPKSGDISAMVERYLEGIAWVYNYYRYGVANLNLDWYYCYYYAPLLDDIVKYILGSQNITWLINPIYTYSSFLNTLVQMVLVIPPESVVLVPAKLRVLYTENSFVMDMYCKKPFFDARGKIEKYQGFYILPAVNSNRILRLFPLLGITQEEFQIYSASEAIELHRNETGENKIETVKARIWYAGRGQRGRGAVRGQGAGTRGGQNGILRRGGQRGRGRMRGMFRGPGGTLAPLAPLAAKSSVFIPQNFVPSSALASTASTASTTVALPASIGGNIVNLIPLAPINTSSFSTGLLGTAPPNFINSSSRGGYSSNGSSERGRGRGQGTSRGTSRGRGGERGSSRGGRGSRGSRDKNY